jgi:CHAT domain-containing protein/Tfp pilus assembly protein PilF
MVVIALSVTGCRSAPTPEATYSELMKEVVRGDMDSALRGATHAYTKYDRKDPYWAWRFRVLKAHILFMRGSDKESLLLLSEDPPASLANSDVVVRQKFVQGLAYQSLQNFDTARRCLDDAVRLAGPGQPELLGTALVSRGTLDIDESHYDRAEADFHQALAIARQQKLPTIEATALGNLGYVAMKEGHYDESIDWNREALQFSQSTGQQVSASPILGNTGWSYFEMGDLDNALDFYKQAEDTSSRAGLAGNRVSWLGDIGNVYHAQHDFVSAESTLRKALELARKLDNNSTITQCLNDLSEIALDNGQIPQAEQYNNEALAIEKAGLDASGVPDSVVAQGRIAASKQDFARAEQLFQQVVDNRNVETSLRWEAQARLAKTFADAGNHAKAEDEFRQSIATIETARASVKSEELRFSFLSTAISFYSDYIDFLVSRGRTEDALEVAELSRTHSLADTPGDALSGLSIPIKGFQPARISARSNAIILSYWLGPRKSYLWAVTPKGVTLFTLAASAEIDSLVRSYRQALAAPPDVLETENASGSKLYDSLIAPASALIPKGSRVMILPDGSLYDLNFETLLAPTPRLHYWIDDVIVDNGNSMLLLAASAQQAAPKSRKLLLIGDPVSPSPDFPDLPDAPAEMSQIEKYFTPSNSTILSKVHATPQAYQTSHPENFSFIHFVAHGTASRTSPLDSAVVLTRHGDSYKLYARDVMKLPLSAYLVTISACHGAGARTYSGEGLVGLTWAFLQAGAHGVIAALWDVNDSSTSQMMGQLYGEMSKGTPPDVALRDSKLAFVHSHSTYRKPFYWAAFQVYRGS